MNYANATTISPEKTKAEIETMLRRYSADQFASGWGQDSAFVAFRCRNRMIRFTLALPKPGEKRFTETMRGRSRTAGQAHEQYEQAVRSAWRCLLLCIRAKLESVESGIESFEEAFLAQIVIPNNGGGTVGEWAKTELPKSYATGEPLALPAFGGGKA